MLEEDDDYIPTDEDIRAAVRLSLTTERWQERLKFLDEITPGALRRRKDSLARSLMVSLQTDQFFTEKDVMYMEAEYVLHDAGYTPHGTSLYKTVNAMLQTLQGYVDKRVQEVFHPESIPTANAGLPQLNQRPIMTATPAKISEFTKPWQKDILQGYNRHPALSEETSGQYLNTVELFIGLMGNLNLTEITFEVAESFREKILELPASHGKGAIRSPKLELARAKSNKGVPLVSMKTAKRHFSGMNSIWKWLIHRKHVPAQPNPFSGHPFPGTKSKKSARDDWSQEDLHRLLTSSEYRTAPQSSALHWLPLISLHSGMRLEEICRLRPDQDIVRRDGHYCFNIVAREGWDPKTECGTRLIPIHSWLLQHGLMDLVTQQRNRGAEHLFSPELVLHKNKLSSGFGRDFSALKIRLGIGKKTTFHSFRHTFRTVLDSTDFKEAHIDAVMGHEGGRGEGRVYSKRVATAKLKEVVEAFISPVELKFLGSADSTSPPPSPKNPPIKKRKLTPPSFDDEGRPIKSRSKSPRTYEPMLKS